MSPDASVDREPATPRVEVVDREMAAVLRLKTPAERLEIGFGLWRYAARTIKAHLGSTHPDWSAGRIDRETARRMASGSW